MYYSDFKGLKLSGLGFGTMRLPLEKDGKTIDRQAVREMTRYAIENGINYFDTAAPYHGGISEIVIGEILKDYPRQSWYLADKYPGHQHIETFDPRATFELQLKKCGVDYFDFYLMHNVCENSFDTYLNPKWGILDYFVEQKKNGRIRHLGFSSHAGPDTLKAFLDSPCGEHMEFCQIQLNYLDWTLQKAKQKCELLSSYGLPIWVMEPLRGGMLARLNEEQAMMLKQHCPESSLASWALRWLQDISGVTMVLSGMSDFSQMQDNVATFSQRSPLSQQEKEMLAGIAANIDKSVPCTGCRYCCDACPSELDIPKLLAAYNDLRLGFNFTPVMLLESLPEDKLPSACLACGACALICPQEIEIPKVLAELSEMKASMPKWSEICRQRAAEAEALEASLFKDSR